MKNKGLYTAFLALTQICVLVGFATVWYCFGGFAMVANKIPNGEGSAGLAMGLSKVIIQILFIVGGIIVAMAVLAQLIGDAGCIVQAASKSREPRRGFIIAAFAPAPLVALLSAAAAVLSMELLPAAGVALIVFAAAEVALFVIGIMCAAGAGKSPDGQSAV